MSQLKSKSLSVFVGLILASAVLGAQAAQTPAKVKDVRQQITLSQDVKVGSTVLKSGKYEVSSKNQELTFRLLVQDPAYAYQWIRDTKFKPVVVKTTPTVLDEKSKSLQLDTTPDTAGVPVLKAITLDDTNVKFTIEQ